VCASANGTISLMEPYVTWMSQSMIICGDR
jgi:hypothetical protein